MTKRKLFQLQEIQKLWIICEYYSNFAQRQMYHTIYTTKRDYADSEKQADLISFITGEDVCAADLMPEKDDVENDILNFTDIMKEAVSLGEKIGLAEEDLIAFSKQTYYSFDNMGLKIYFIQMEWAMEAFVKYKSNMFDKEQLTLAINIPMSPFKGSKPLSHSYLRKIIRDTKKLYSEIEQKRSYRRIKNSGFRAEQIIDGVKYTIGCDPFHEGSKSIAVFYDNIASH